MKRAIDKVSPLQNICHSWPYLLRFPRLNLVTVGQTCLPFWPPSMGPSPVMNTVGPPKGARPQARYFLLQLLKMNLQPN